MENYLRTSLHMRAPVGPSVALCVRLCCATCSSFLKNNSCVHACFFGMRRYNSSAQRGPRGRCSAGPDRDALAKKAISTATKTASLQLEIDAVGVDGQVPVDATRDNGDATFRSKVLDTMRVFPSFSRGLWATDVLQGSAPRRSHLRQFIRCAQAVLVWLLRL
jgi:hypothetical protein